MTGVHCRILAGYPVTSVSFGWLLKSAALLINSNVSSSIQRTASYFWRYKV